jgi:hypothetical protein
MLVARIYERLERSGVLNACYSILGREMCLILAEYGQESIHGHMWASVEGRG